MVMSGDHDYTRREAWEALLRNDSTDGEATEPPESGNDDGNETSVTETAPENPSKGGPDPDPDASDGPAPVPPEVEEGCPDCGGELADMRDTETITRDGVMYDTPDDFYCNDCGTGWNLE